MTFGTSRTRNIILASIFCALGVWGVASHYVVRYQVNRDAERLQRIIASLAASDPAFARLKVVRSTHPKAWIFGTLDTPSHRAALQDKVAEVFGQHEADRITGNVELAPPATSPIIP